MVKMHRFQDQLFTMVKASNLNEVSNLKEMGFEIIDEDMEDYNKMEEECKSIYKNQK